MSAMVVYLRKGCSVRWGQMCWRTNVGHIIHVKVCIARLVAVMVLTLERATDLTSRSPACLSVRHCIIIYRVPRPACRHGLDVQSITLAANRQMCR